MITETGSNPLRVLLVADEEFNPADFLELLESRNSGRSVKVFVIAPALVDTALEDELGAIDGGIEAAERRLGDVVEKLESVGIRAVGRVGDSRPETAVGDGLREFDIDEVFVVAHSEDQRKYAERDLWKDINRKYTQPITEILVRREPGGERIETIDVLDSPAKHESEEDRIIRERNFPPLRRRDELAIAVGILGTVLLGLIAVAAGLADDGVIHGASAAILLIAIGSFLINIAHVVGIFFFGSIRYGGVWERFMYVVTLAYTLAGLAAAGFLWLVVL